MGGVDVMADDPYARIAQLEAELQRRDVELGKACAEIEGRDRKLSEALEQQTGLAEVLRVIAASPTDLQHVLEAVAQRAFRLGRASSARIYLVEGEILRMAASVAESHELTRFTQTIASVGFETPRAMNSMVGRTAIENRPLHIANTDTDEVRKEFPGSPTGGQIARTRLHVPLQRDGAAIGVLAVSKKRSNHSRTERSRSSRRSQTKPSSRSKLHGCSRNCGRASSSRQPRLRCCG